MTLEHVETSLEDLGFDRSDKLLIIHADDVGMCHSVNIATIEGFRKGIVSSCSIMSPCPWVPEAIELLKGMMVDIGVHVTLNSEWKGYKWRPITKALTICDENGYLFSNPRDTATYGDMGEVREEIRAQVAMLRRSLRLSHIDTHMGTIYIRFDFFKAYVEVALEEGLIPMIPKPHPHIIAWARAQGLPIDEKFIEFMKSVNMPKLDMLVPDIHGNTYEERVKFFKKIIKSIAPGTITQIIVHLGLDTEEIRAIIGESYKLRYFDYKMVMNREVMKLIEESNITLIGWRDLLEKWRKIT